MIELTRRWFVFGSAAAIAATQIPLVAPELVPSIIPMPAQHTFLRRELIDLIASFDYDKAVDEAGDIRIIGPRGDSVMHVKINTKAIYRWVSHEGEEGIIIRPDESFSFVAESNGAAIGKLKAVFMDYIDDGPPVYVTESYPNDGEPPQYLYTDNSREARDRRWEEMKEAAKRGWVDDGLCDEDFDVNTPVEPGTT